MTVGLILASIGGYRLYRTLDLLKNGLRSQGKVVELRRIRAYMPVVQFETPDHKTITVACKIGTNPPRHHVGDYVTVLYRALHPEDICLEEPFQLWFLPCLFGGLGLIFSVVGGGLMMCT